MQIRKATGAIVLAIRKSEGQMQFNPSADDCIAVGDVLITIGEPEGLRKLEIMVCGEQR
jgi:K+/H+ antiporter YhaU regulatory subunit KhtT